METHSGPGVVSRVATWSGGSLSLLVALLMIFSAVMKLLKPAAVVQGFAHYGYPEAQTMVLGIVEGACALIYLMPRTSVLGAVLLTGYLGGATASNVRVGDPWFASVDAAVAKVRKLGGKVVAPKTPVPEMGYFSVCNDTGGNVFALWERNENAA